MPTLRIFFQKPFDSYSMSSSSSAADSTTDGPLNTVMDLKATWLTSPVPRSGRGRFSVNTLCEKGEIEVTVSISNQARQMLATVAAYNDPDYEKMNAVVWKIQENQVDPFFILADPSVTIDLVIALLQRKHVAKLLEMFLEEQNTFGSFGNEDTVWSWPVVLGRLINFQQCSAAADYPADENPLFWLDVVLNPSSHDIFKHVLGPAHISLWAAFVTTHTVVHPHPLLPTTWRTRLEQTLFGAKDVRQWLVSSANFSRWLIDNKFVVAENYIDFKARYFTWTSYSNALDWTILSDFFAESETNEKERAEKEKAAKVAEYEAALAKALAPKTLTVVRRQIFSVTDLDNYVRLHFDNNVCPVRKYRQSLEYGSEEQKLTDDVSSYVEINDHWIYRVLESHSSDKTIFMDKLQRSQISNELESKVRHLSVFEMDKLACEADKITIEITPQTDAVWDLRLVRSELIDFLLDQSIVFVPYQRHKCRRAYVDIWATEFTDGKKERARTIGKKTVIAFVIVPSTNRGQKVTIVEERKLPEFA